HLERPGHAGAHALAGRQIGDVPSLEKHASSVGHQLPAEEVDESRLSGAVGADERGDSSGRKRQIHARDRAEVCERLAQAAHFEEGGHATSSWRAARSSRARAVPSSPPRNASTTPSRTSPKTSSQYSVKRTMISLSPR